MIDAGEEHFDPGVEWLGLFEYVVEQCSLPERCRDGVVAPRLTGGQGSHLQSPVSGALEGDDSLDRAHPLQVVEAERDRIVDRTADFDPTVMVGYREVAADVVQLGRRDVGFECFGGRLRVERLAVDHRQCSTFAFQIVCQSHFGSPRMGCRGRPSSRDLGRWGLGPR